MKLKKKQFILFFFLIVSLLLMSCAQVPITGRNQLNLIPDSSIFPMSFQQYSQFLDSNVISTNSRSSEMVTRVGRRIQHGVEEYFRQQHMAHRLDGYKWEFHLVDSEEKNAWCMPGGKVVVYSGLLSITRDEAGLAVVMGHEIAHAVANHGNERMSHSLLVQMGGVALSTAVREHSVATQQLWMTAFGVSTQYGFALPYSRLHEKEADHLGLIFMAMAGYDPHVALDFWQRMSAEKKGGAPPEFLSTHPSDQRRIESIRSLIPKAMKYYHH